MNLIVTSKDLCNLPSYHIRDTRYKDYVRNLVDQTGRRKGLFLYIKKELCCIEDALYFLSELDYILGGERGEPIDHYEVHGDLILVVYFMAASRCRLSNL